MRGAMPAEPDNSYVIRFTALGAQVLPDEAADLLREALEATPGTGPVHGATHDPGARTVSGEFLLNVHLGIADAARDGSRLAREALKNAGFGDAQLVELYIALRVETA